jgi:hypothetical protein
LIIIIRYLLIEEALLEVDHMAGKHQEEHQVERLEGHQMDLSLGDSLEVHLVDTHLRHLDSP